jgi:hypothetical protein
MRGFVLAALLMAGVADKPAYTVTGKGYQVYACGDNGAWVFQAPEATLYLNGEVVGRHGKGPSWTWKDGSSITGKVVTNAPAPSPGEDIPWLTLDAMPVPGTSGVLSEMVQVRRTETHGGVAPSTGCDAAHKGAVTRVPYSATYSFWAK